jgi:hypothetical protein
VQADDDHACGGVNEHVDDPRHGSHSFCLC